jgi:serine/threonine protein kinase
MRDFSQEQVEELFSSWREVPDHLGKGACGEVFKCNQLAIKWMRNFGFLRSKELSNYNKDEWELLENLPFHRSIIQYFSRFKFTPPREFLSGVTSRSNTDLLLLLNPATQQPLPQQFIILKYFSGGDLKKFTNTQGTNLYKPGSETRILQMCEDVAQGVKFLFEKRIVHRDLKLENLLISSSGVVALCDFGLALSLPPDWVALLDANDATGGNPEHLAPEVRNAPVKQMEGKFRKLINYKFQPSWELGILFFEIAFGQGIFQDFELTRMIDVRGHNEQFRGQTNINYPEAFVDLIVQCLQLQPELRPTPDRICGVLKDLAGARDERLEIGQFHFC